MRAGIILVRLDSKRFPNKAFSILGKKKLIEYPIQALLNDNFFTPIIATTDRSVDTPLAELGEQYNIKIFRGSLDNIQKRVIDCIHQYNITEFIRINGDSPFLRIDLLKQGYDILQKNNYDFVTNLYPRSFPYGISIEIFKSNVFIGRINQMRTEFYREHITSYFYENIEQFNYKNILLENGQNHQDIRLTVDTKEDLKMIQKMIDMDENIFEKDIEEIVKIYKQINRKG